MHLKEQYNKTLMVDIGGFPPKADFFRIKQVFLSLQILTSKSVNSRL